MWCGPHIQASPLFSKTLWPIMVLLTTLVIITGCRSKPQEIPTEKQKNKKQIATTDYQAPSPAPEIVFEEPDLPQPAEVKLGGQTTAPGCDSPIPKKSRPRIAIIIDDMGYHQKIGDKLLDMDLALTFSFLPQAPFTRKQEEKAYLKGRDILVHLPMEAQDPSWNLGPGALYLSHSPEMIAATIKKNINAVPHAIGANNHMGSRFTEQHQAMRVVLAELKKQKFFFIDSYTSVKSTGMDEAKKMGVPTARRHIFLDNVQEQSRVCRQLEQLVALAGKQGWAIGIGHPNQATLIALTRCREQLLEHVDLVGVHQLVQ